VHACYVRRKPKYSDEQQNIAFEHYISHGRCFAFTRKAIQKHQHHGDAHFLVNAARVTNVRRISPICLSDRAGWFF
jgi:hypothetical protein